MSGIEVGILEPNPVMLDEHGQRILAGWGGGAYRGADLHSRTLREWQPRLGSADSDTLPDLCTLRSRSRDAVRNHPLATGAINTVVSSTVGSGIEPHPRVDRQLLKLSDEQADEFETDAKRIWTAATTGNGLDIQRRLSFAQQTAVVARGVLESGDIAGLRRYRQDRDTLLGLKLQLIEADRISNPNNGPDTPQLAGGIEYDRDGQPIRFHVRSRHPGDWYFGVAAGDMWDAIAVRGAATGDMQVLHVYDPLRPGQSRGVPFLAPVIEPLKQLTRYSTSELEAAVVSSFFTVFVRRNDPLGENAPSPLASVDPRNLGRSAEATVGLEDRQLRLGQGMVQELNNGEDISIADPKRPNENFDPFFLAIVRQMGVALEIPFELMVKHFTASYSAARAALLEFWRSVLRRRAWLVTQWCQPVYEMAIGEAIARGLLRAPGFYENPMLRQAWSTAAWTGPTQGQIDPLAEVQASRELVEGGFSTLEEQTTKLTGGDWETNHRQQAKERRWRERDGLTTEQVAERVAIEPREPIPADGSTPAPGKPAVPPPADRGTTKPPRATAAEHAARRARLSAVGVD